MDNIKLFSIFSGMFFVGFLISALIFRGATLWILVAVTYSLAMLSGIIYRVYELLKGE